MADKKKILFSISKENGNDQVICQQTEFNGKEYVDVRFWYKDKETEEMKPTKKGCMMRPSEFVEFQKKLAKVKI